jgi:GT2 family glycosyltransferase
VIAKTGTLDTAFFMYYEEVDYCFRCKQAGYTVFFEAEAGVWHEGGGSSRKVKVLTIRRTMRSMRHYFAKRRGKWTVLPLSAIVSLDLVTHFFHALLTRNRPLATFKAYFLGWWDVITLRSADS